MLNVFHLHRFGAQQRKKKAAGCPAAFFFLGDETLSA
jgi:hypothetical protein